MNSIKFVGQFLKSRFSKDGSLGVISLFVIIALSIAWVWIALGRISWVRSADFFVPLLLLALVVFFSAGRRSDLEGTMSRKDWVVKSWQELYRTLIGAFILFVVMLLPFGPYAIVGFVVGVLCGFVGFGISVFLGVLLLPSKMIHRKLIGVIPSVSVAYGMGFLVWPLVFL